LFHQFAGVRFGDRLVGKRLVADWPLVPLRPNRTSTSLPQVSISQNLLAPPPTHSKRRLDFGLDMMDLLVA
jgi:hypothetical protein